LKAVVELKTYNFVTVHNNKEDRDDAIIETKFCKRPGYSSKKIEAVTIEYISGDVKRHDEYAKRNTENKKSAVINRIHVFRVKEEIWYTQD